MLGTVAEASAVSETRGCIIAPHEAVALAVVTDVPVAVTDAFCGGD